jgi:hypothetical protein
MRLSLSLSLLALAACGAPSMQDAGTDAGAAFDAGTTHDAGTVDAGHEHDAGTIDAGHGHDAGTTDAGTDAFDLSVAFGAAVARANNELNIALVEHGGAAISGATVTVALFMPDHGHGQPAPTVTEPTPGHFRSMITFIMPGTWDITVTATSNTRVVTKKLTVLVP